MINRVITAVAKGLASWRGFNGAAAVPQSPAVPGDAAPASGTEPASPKTKRVARPSARNVAAGSRGPKRRTRGADRPTANPDLIYRFGFVAGSSDFDLRRKVPENWRTERVGAYTLRLHRETEFFAIDGAAVVGPVVGRGGGSVEQILRALRSAPLDRFALLLGDLIGRFAVIVARDDGARVFHDAFGSRALFYSTRAPGLVASHSALLADVIGAAPDPAVRGFMKAKAYTRLAVRYLPGDLTLYSDVYGLAPNNGYRMDGGTERYWPLAPRVASDRETFFALLDQNIADLARLAVTRHLVLGITGGVDSRVIAAGLVKHRKPFDGVTWTRRGGGYLPDHERPAVEQTVALLGLRHCYVDVREHLDSSGVASHVNSGRLRGASSLTSGMATIAGRAYVFVRGYGGEILRGFYNIQRDPMTSASPEELSRLYQKRNPQRDPFVLRAFEAYWRRANWDGIDRMGYDPNDIFYWEHRMGAWGAMMLNAMDAGVESWVGLNSRPLYEAAFGLASAERLTKSLLAEAVTRFYAPLAAVPVHLQNGVVLDAQAPALA